MPQYGEVRVDFITYTTGVAPNEGNVTVPISGLINAPTFSGDVVIEGGLTVSGLSTFNDITVTGDATIGGDLTVSGDINASGVTISGINGLFASGTEAAPSISFVDDTDTGLYSPSANEVAISTSGTGRLFVDAGGNVGVGVNPPSALAHISSSYATPSTGGINANTRLIVSNNNLASSEANISLLYRSNAKGRLNFGSQIVEDVAYVEGGVNYLAFGTGSGTASAAERLRITSTGQIQSGGLGSAASPALSFSSDTNTGIYSPGADQLALSTNGTGRLFVDASGSILFGKTSQNAAVAGFQHRGDAIGLVQITRNSGEPLQLNRLTDDGKLIDFRQDTNLIGSISVQGSDLGIDVNGSERLRITSAGLVGIGTSSPGSLNSAANQLVVGGGSGNQGVTIYTGNGVGDQGSIFFADGTTGGSQQAAGYIFYRHDTDSMALGTANNPRLTIDSAGRVGIGTSSPQSKLDVIGTDVSYPGLKSADAPTTVVANAAANTYVRVAGGSYANASSVNLDLSVGQAKNTNIQSGWRLKAKASATVANPSGSDFQIIPTTLPTVTAANLTEGTPALTILNTGSVGIGSTSPQAPFVVSNGGAEGIEAGWSGGSSSNYIQSYNRSTSAFGQLDLIGTPLVFKNGATEAARIDSSSRLLVGTSSDLSGGDADARLQVNGDAGAQILLSRQDFGALTAGTLIGEVVFRSQASGVKETSALIKCEADATQGSGDKPGRLVFSTTADGASSPTERMRITNTGETSLVAVNNAFASASTQSAGTSYAVFTGWHSATAGTAFSGTISCYIWNNGNIQNTNNSYGAISDSKLKENIVDANSQWDDIKALQVRNYNFKEGQTHTQIGLVAQEVELVSPGLVSESPDRDEEGNDLGTVTKSVNYSVLYMKAVKALQEAMDRIETLEAKVAALENQ